MENPLDNDCAHFGPRWSIITIIKDQIKEKDEQRHIMTDKMISQLKFVITHFALTATNMDETNEIRPRLSLKHTEIVTGLYHNH